MRRLKSQAGKVKWANDRAGLATPASKAPHSCRRHVVRRTVASTRRPQQHSPPRSARSHGRRPVPSRPSMGRGLVSIRALAWRATIEIIRRDVLGLVFRSTPSHGVRHDDIRVVDKPGLFRSTPSHRGRPTIRTTSKRPRAFRSTPSHGGRHDPVRGLVRPAMVSIHALAWRATGRFARVPGLPHVSIHALAWRATLSACVHPT